MLYPILIASSNLRLALVKGHPYGLKSEQNPAFKESCAVEDENIIGSAPQ